MRFELSNQAIEGVEVHFRNRHTLFPSLFSKRAAYHLLHELHAVISGSLRQRVQAIFRTKLLGFNSSSRGNVHKYLLHEFTVELFRSVEAIVKIVERHGRAQRKLILQGNCGLEGLGEIGRILNRFLFTVDAPKDQEEEESKSSQRYPLHTFSFAATLNRDAVAAVALPPWPPVARVFG